MDAASSLMTPEAAQTPTTGLHTIAADELGGQSPHTRPVRRRGAALRQKPPRGQCSVDRGPVLGQQDRCHNAGVAVQDPGDLQPGVATNGSTPDPVYDHDSPRGRGHLSPALLLEILAVQLAYTFICLWVANWMMRDPDAVLGGFKLWRRKGG